MASVALKSTVSCVAVYGLREVGNKEGVELVVAANAPNVLMAFWARGAPTGDGVQQAGMTKVVDTRANARLLHRIETEWAHM